MRKTSRVVSRDEVETTKQKIQEETKENSRESWKDFNIQKGEKELVNETEERRTRRNSEM